MTVDEELLRAAAGAFAEPFDGVLCVAPIGGAPFWVDGRVRPPQVCATPPADVGRDDPGVCTWFAARDTVMGIFEEERYLAGCFVSGRLNIAGDMSVMTRLRLGAHD